jgi:hypothetical protein
LDNWNVTIAQPPLRLSASQASEASTQPLGAEADRAACAPDWWLDVLSRSAHYRQAEVFEGDDLLARIPYFVRRSRLGFNWGRNPDWSPARPFICHPQLAHGKRIEAVVRLLKRLPPNISFYFSFREHADWSPDLIEAFERCDFEHSVAPTYEWHPDGPSVLDLMKSKARSQLRLAQKSLRVVEISCDAFLSYYSKNLELQGERPSRSLSLAKVLLDAGLSRRAVRITAACNSANPATYDAAIACTWDNDRYYYWMSSHRLNFPGSTDCKPHKDAAKVLILDAMQQAHSLGLIFDTDGVNSAGTEHMYRDILKLARADTRHVFRRMSRFVALYEKYRPLMLHVLARN